MRGFGATPEQIENAIATARDAPVDVFHENRKALRVFLASSSQWLRGPMGEPLTLLSQSVEAEMRMIGITRMRDVIWRVRAIEGGAMKVMQARRERDAAKSSK